MLSAGTSDWPKIGRKNMALLTVCRERPPMVGMLKNLGPMAPAASAERFSNLRASGWSRRWASGWRTSWRWAGKCGGVLRDDGTFWD